MFQRLERLPRVVRVGISFPSDLVLQVAAKDTGIKDLFNFPLVPIIDYDGRRWRLNSVW